MTITIDANTVLLLAGIAATAAASWSQRQRQQEASEENTRAFERLTSEMRRNDDRSVKRDNALLEVETANNAFLARGPAVDPGRKARATQSFRDMQDAAVQAGVDPGDILEALRAEMEADQ